MRVTGPVMAAEAPKVIIIAGPNGSGKSTLAPAILRDSLGIRDFVNADTIAVGLSAFDPEKVAIEAGRIMLHRLRELADAGESFAFETTLSGRSYASWLRAQRARGYEVHLFLIWLSSADIAIERVRHRVQMGGHGIPEEIIRRRYRSGLENFRHLYRPLADTWTVYDNSRSQGPGLVATGHLNSDFQIFEHRTWNVIIEANL